MELINFYHLDGVKKYLYSPDDLQKQYTGIPLFEHILFCGATKSGKTLSLINYIELGQKEKLMFDKVYCVFKTEEPLYSFLSDTLGDKMVRYKSIKELPQVNDFEDTAVIYERNKAEYEKDKKNKKKKAEFKKPPLYLLILDDCINDRGIADKKIQDYYAFGRKKGFTICYLSQSYFHTNDFVRKNTSWVILNGINSETDLRNICLNYSLPNVNYKTLGRMYEYCKIKKNNDDVNFMKICCYYCDKNKKISKNFLDYLNPDEFKENNLKNKKQKEETPEINQEPITKQETNLNMGGNLNNQLNNSDIIFIGLKDLL